MNLGLFPGKGPSSTSGIGLSSLYGGTGRDPGLVAHRMVAGSGVAVHFVVPGNVEPDQMGPRKRGSNYHYYNRRKAAH